jgi:hypothetical protein
VAGQHLEQSGRVGDRRGEGADLIEGAGEGDEPVTRDETVGRFDPDDPQSAAGWRIDPPVSLPMASGVIPAATEAAEPPEEPPGTREGSWGFRVGPKAEFSVDDPMANSSRLVLPTGTAPAASRRSMTVAL